MVYRGYYTMQSAIIAAFGGFMYGVDTGLIATTIAHESFSVKMFGPHGNAPLKGAVVSVYSAGQCVGAVLISPISDRFSRKRAIGFAALLAVIGTTIQTASVNVGMMIAGRLIAGLSSGMAMSVVPVYISELSPPKDRAFVVGMVGAMTSIGFCVANWIGYAGGFAHGDGQWRIPLGCQIPCGLLLFVGSLVIPYTPRWLTMRGRYDEAKKILADLHSNEGETFVLQEFQQIHDQILFEAESRSSGLWNNVKNLFARQYLHRTSMAVWVAVVNELTGVGVIQNYQSILYATVGYTGRTALLISGLYGFMGVIGQAINLIGVADRIGRRMTLILGSACLCALLCILTALTATYGHPGADQNGTRAAIAFIFIFSAVYAVFFNSTINIVPAELFPSFLRSQGLGFSQLVRGAVTIALTQASPSAFAAGGWKYYFMFIFGNVLAAVVFYFYLPETNGKTLEEIAVMFGDVLATEKLEEIDVTKAALEGEHLEDRAQAEKTV